MIDLDALEDFYATPKGHLLRLSLKRYLDSFQEKIQGLTLLGHGFTSLYLSDFQDQASHIFYAMPAMMGVRPLQSPKHTNISFSCHEGFLPLESRSMDGIFLIHSLEYAPDAEAFLHQAWRVLKEDGFLSIMVPNRRGLWAHSVDTPLGCGTPYTGWQLYHILEKTGFTVLHKPLYGLFYPPMKPLLKERFLLSWEKKLSRCFVKKMGGIVMITACKKIIAGAQIPEETALFTPSLNPVGTP